MLNKIFILISVLVAVFLGIFLYLFLAALEAPQTIPAQNQTEVILSPEEQLAKIKTEYPEVIKGVITFFDTKTLWKATIRTKDGKEYILWPSQPKSVYEFFGVKSGGNVEVQGRFSGDDRIEWKLIKPI